MHTIKLVDAFDVFAHARGHAFDAFAHAGTFFVSSHMLGETRVYVFASVRGHVFVLRVRNVWGHVDVFALVQGHVPNVFPHVWGDAFDVSAHVQTHFDACIRAIGRPLVPPRLWRATCACSSPGEAKINWHHPQTAPLPP